jgi:hypothetical protein
MPASDGSPRSPRQPEGSGTALTAALVEAPGWDLEGKREDRASISAE